MNNPISAIFCFVRPSAFVGLMEFWKIQGRVREMPDSCVKSRSKTYLLFVLAWCLLSLWPAIAAAEQAQTGSPANNPRLAFFIPRHDPFWDLNVRYARAAAQSLGAELKIFDFKDETAELIRQVERVCQAGTEGIILQAFGIATETVFKLANKYGTAVILINTSIEDADFLPRSKYRMWLGKITPDDVKAGTTLIQQLMQLAKQSGLLQYHILAIEGRPDQEASIARRKGLESYIKYASEVESYEIVPGNWDPQTAARRFRLQYEKNPQINLVWCANDNMALAVAGAIKEMGIKKPIFLGGVDWDPRALEAIGKGGMHASVGGHFIEGAWAVILLHDYLKGKDFASEGTSFSTTMPAISKSNLEVFSNFLTMEPDRLNFRRYSKVYNPKHAEYTFNLAKVAQDLSQRLSQNAFISKLSGAEQAFLKMHPRITIGAMDAWPPMNFLDASGKPSGIGADYLKALNQRLGGVLELVPGPFTKNFGLVKNKRLDALMDITPKPEREEFFNFTVPYLTIPHVIVARKDGPYYSTEPDLKGKTLALEKGFYSVKYFRENNPDVTVKEYPDTAKALGAVSRSEADAYAGNRAVASWIMEAELISNLQVQGRLSRPGSVLAIGVRKDWPLLASILDKATADIPRKEIREMHRHWAGFEEGVIGHYQPSQQESAFLQAHSKLKLGVAPSWAPFDFIDHEGKYAGICSDYMRIVGHRLGLEINPVKDLTWAQVLEGAKAGRIDLVAAIVRTKEREEYLTFSKPYLKVPLVIITREDAAYTGGMDDLKGGAVAVTKGYATQAILEKEHPELELMMVDTVDQAFKAVAEGRALAAIEAVASLDFAKRSLGLKELKVAAPTPYSLDICIGVRKDLSPLAPLLDKVLAGFDEDEKYLIRDKWLKVQIQERVDWGFIIKAGGAAALVGGIILAVILIWNRRLAGEITQRKAVEERFQTMAANVPGAIFQMRIQKDGSLEHIYLSQRAEEFFGAGPEVIIKEKRQLNFHPKDQERIARQIAQARLKKSDVELVGRIIVSGGETRWVRISATPSTSAGGIWSTTGSSWTLHGASWQSRSIWKASARSRP
jgi:PAS domain S-box-containing protein